MFWVFIIIVVLTYIINKLTLKYGLKDVVYKREISKNVVEIGEEFEISTIIENRKFLPVTFLRVEEKFPDMLEYKFKANYISTGGYIFHITTMFVLPYQRIKRTYSITGNERGIYVFRDVNLGAGDFVGFGMNYTDIDYFQELVVLPQKAQLGKVLVPYGSYNGDVSVKRWIIDDPLMNVGVREYTGREPEKYIHWPSSLKYGRLMVKNFDFTTDNRVIILLNVESSKPFWSSIEKEQIEKCISICRGILEEMEEKKIPYGFTTNSQISDFYNGDNLTHPGIGAAHFGYILEALGRTSYGLTLTFEEFIENIIGRRERFTTYVIVTPKVFDSYLNPIERLKKVAEKLVVISIQEENLDLLSNDIIKYSGRND